MYIRNFAIIDELRLEFNSGLTVITGETGAGKSILLGALSLILGERADSKSIQEGSSKCIIEGSFDITQNEEAIHWLQINDLYEGSEVTIRRELQSNGKSRIFVNDTPSTLTNIQELSRYLIDLHRQFDTIELQDNAYQLSIVDETARNHAIRLKYVQTYQSWKQIQTTLHTVTDQNRIARQELDYHQFVLSELLNFQLQENELENIESELEILQQTDSLKIALQSVSQHLQTDEQSAIDRLRNALHPLLSYRDKIESIRELSERLESSLIEIKDIATEIEQVYERTTHDPEKLMRLNDRLNEGNRLLKKHGLHHTQDLLNLQNELQEKINNAEQADDQEKELKLKLDQITEELTILANQLTASRVDQLSHIEQNVNQLLVQVGMPNAMMNIQHQQGPLTSNGQDQIQFLFDANRSGKFQPISKVASGGELSRLMLCIKSLLASSAHLPVLVFDEIDAGISGETAMQVGMLLKKLAKSHQIITITHLPQIAGKADHHYYIYKTDGNQGPIHTKVKLLGENDRIEALAEMLSGKNSSESTLKTAKELLK